MLRTPKARASHPSRGVRAHLPTGVRPLATAAVALAAWAVVAVPIGLMVFLNSERTLNIAGHQADISPTAHGYAEISLGPFLPGFRYPTDSRIGADIDLGRTSLGSYEALFERYAFIASQPDAQIRKVEDALTEMALDSLLVGALAGAAGPAVWLLLGPRRRHELVATRHARALTGGTVLLVGTVLVSAAVQPWNRAAAPGPTSAWTPLSQALPGVTVPAQAQRLEVDAGLLSRGSRRLVSSALDSYRVSSDFYTSAAEKAADLAADLRQPADDETVGLLVSDRHDNIGMDPVARAIGDAGGATFLMSAGDDTSTGSTWEAFSLESLDEAFADIDDRFFVAGNHDHGDFITEQAAELGFTTLDGEVVEGPDGIRLLGVDDPRSSGLGNWRDETGLSFGDVTDRVTEAACASDEAGERVSTILVHDAKNGAGALAEGCADLVLAGHLHVVVGPEPVEGPDGEIGYSFTTGTTGGAAYAIAIGTKPRRDATVTLVTYREGRPIGVQSVSLSPLGKFTVSEYTPLVRTSPSVGPVRASTATR